jgi:hypothetical protein
MAVLEKSRIKGRFYPQQSFYSIMSAHPVLLLQPMQFHKNISVSLNFFAEKCPFGGTSVKKMYA